MATDTPRIPEQGVATLPDEAWERARRRAEIIGPLAQSETVGHEATDMAAQALGLSRRQVYVLIRRARQGSGLVTDLVPGQSGGGKGKGRLPEPVERIIRELLQKRFLTKQKRTLAAFHREVAQVCKMQKLRVPARNTVALRITGLDPRKVTRCREGQDAARDLQGAGGEPPAVTAPLEQVQIDHTVIDLIVVDVRDRQPIGRPYLTIAIDVFTRSVLGMVVTLEAPSAVSVGLCLVHVACDKRPWLERLNVEMEWPMSGKPRLLYLDNAAEFKSEALRRGCDQHGIRLDYRPLGQPHYGGVVERIIGTAMQMIHDELPGTTFSNPDQRGEYTSEKMAALTLRELERWLTLAVGTYHGSVHNGLLQPPAARWTEAIARTGVPTVITRATAFLVDFLPIIRRTLTRTGFVIDHIHYYADALKPWIARRDRLPAFLIRCDSSIFCSALHSQFRTEIGSQTMISQNTNQWPTAIYVPRAGRYGKSVPIAESCLLHLADISMLSVWGKGIPQFGKGIRLLSAFPGEYPLGQDRSIGRWQVGATTAAELSLVRKHTETFYHEPEVLNHSTSVRQYRILFGIKQDFLSKFELPELSEFIASLFDKTGGCIRSFDRRTLIVREFIWPPPTPPPPNAKNTCEAFAPTMKLAPDEKTLLSGKMDTSKFTKLQKIKYWLAIAMGGISILLSSLVIAAQLLKQYI